MKSSYQKIGGLSILLVLFAGCGSPAPPASKDAPSVNSHVLAGYPPLPATGEPAPLSSANPFGLYAVPPTPATVDALSKGVTSPDGRFRAALTDQGAWAVRVDGAWFWQVELTTGAAPGQASTGAQASPNGQLGAQTGQVGQISATAAQTASALGGWTPSGALLVQASGGAWFEANPLTATVTPLAPFWQGRSSLLASPDGKQILYSQTGPKGPQVWVANKDGSRPTLVADNATAVWGADNKPVVTKIPEPPAGTTKKGT